MWFGLLGLWDVGGILGVDDGCGDLRLRRDSELGVSGIHLALDWWIDSGFRTIPG